MKHTLIILLLLSLSLTINAQVPPPGQPGQQPSGQNQPNPNNTNQPQLPPPQQQANNPCDPNKCESCDSKNNWCVDCKRGYYLNYQHFCDDRDDYEDRGDGVSVAVAVINIIFLFVLHHGWTYYSRKNLSTYLNLNYANQSQALSAQNLNRLQNNNNNNNDDGSPELIKIGAPSEFDTRSKKSSVVQPQYDEKNNVFGNYKTNNNNNNNQNVLKAVQMPAFDIEQNASPDYTNGYAIQNGVSNNFSPPQMMGVPQQQQQQQQQQQNQQKQFVTADLNGYWMTQAGKFSFKNFSNLHRIKHVTINIMILQRILSSMFYWAGRRGDDNDNDDRKQLLFIAFFVCLLFYWLFTLIPPIFIKIFSCCWCLQKDPNGRCSNIFIGICFYLAAVIMTIVTTSIVVRMSGFEAQVWILLCLAAYLIIVFFDKKSVELAKRNRAGCMESLVKFRKIDFTTAEQNQQNNNNNNNNI